MEPPHAGDGSPLPLSDAMLSRFGSPQEVRRLGSSPRSLVWSVAFHGSPAIVKQVTGGPDAGQRYDREVTALRLAARARPPVVPMLLATDPETRLLVLERVDDLDPSPDWPVAWASALARLHAATGPADRGQLPAWRPPTTDDVQAFLRLARTLGVPAVDHAQVELEQLLDRLEPAGHPALLHGDPCPGNDLHGAPGVRFVDLEQASLGNGLVELAYLRIGFPTCWSVTSVADEVRERAESAYRSAWSRATGTDLPQDLSGALVDACAGWLIRGDALVEQAHRGSSDHLARVAEHDWGWGTVTARQRLAHRLAVVAVGTAGRSDVAGLHRLTASMHGRLLQRWPDISPIPATGGSSTRTSP